MLATTCVSAPTKYVLYIIHTQQYEKNTETHGNCKLQSGSSCATSSTRRQTQHVRQTTDRLVWGYTIFLEYSQNILEYAQIFPNIRAYFIQIVLRTRHLTNTTNTTNTTTWQTLSKMCRRRQPWLQYTMFFVAW